ncbi:hypothetical protein BKA80DRAFT_655 [Phyllosticta citrichinensis]
MRGALLSPLFTSSSSPIRTLLLARRYDCWARLSMISSSRPRNGRLSPNFTLMFSSWLSTAADSGTNSAATSCASLVHLGAHHPSYIPAISFRDSESAVPRGLSCVLCVTTSLRLVQGRVSRHKPRDDLIFHHGHDLELGRPVFAPAEENGDQIALECQYLPSSLALAFCPPNTTTTLPRLCSGPGRSEKSQAKRNPDS